MDSGLRNSLITVCRVLNKHNVAYLIVGGTAVALYGYFRMSISISGATADKPDLDFWYNPTYNNYFNLLDAIGELGEDVSEFKNEKTPNPRKSFFKLSFEEFTIDFLPELPGLAKFMQCYLRKEISTIDDIDITFIDLDDLITNKQTIAREKDLTDIEELKKKNNI